MVQYVEAEIEESTVSKGEEKSSFVYGDADIEEEEDDDDEDYVMDYTDDGDDEK